MHSEKLILLLPGLGRILVAVLAVVFCYRTARPQARWFWIGAGLWKIAVALKLICAILTNAAVLASLKCALPYPAFVALGGLYVGVQSSVFEIGFTTTISLENAQELHCEIPS